MSGAYPVRDAGHGREGDDDREEHVEEEDRHECGGCDRYLDRSLDRPPAQAQDCLGDEGHHGGLDAIEDRRGGGGVLERRVQDREREQHDDAGQDEEQARSKAAARAVQEPTRVRRELLRLRAGQQHAVVQRVEKTALVDPFAALNDLAVHDRDLTGGAAKAVEPDVRPGAKRVAERDTLDLAHCVERYRILSGRCRLR